MAVLVESSAGRFAVDLFVDECPENARNFLKLCKCRAFEGVLFFDVKPEWVQTGDPRGDGRGGASYHALLGGGRQAAGRAAFVKDEITPALRIDRAGLVVMASDGPDRNGSRFLITLNERGVQHLDGTKTVVGEVAEGMEVVREIAAAHADDRGRPFRDIRILRTHVLIDPFPDPEGLRVPEGPERERPAAEVVEQRIAFHEKVDDDAEIDEKQRAEREKARDMRSRAIALEMMGDLPDADVAPPENVLFVCKLNPATQSDDLEIIFSRFGDVKSCQVIRDRDTGASLQYAFVEFSSEQECQEAYFKMDNVLIDDRRIKVDFSQSVSKAMWGRFRSSGSSTGRGGGAGAQARKRQRSAGASRDAQPGAAARRQRC